MTTKSKSATSTSTAAAETNKSEKPPAVRVKKQTERKK
jgi:hypothetical protein